MNQILSDNTKIFIKKNKKSVDKTDYTYYNEDKKNKER